jgi:signal transduction histidine kinase
MLEEQAIKPERVWSAITAIARNADSLRQLVDDLIDTNQLVAGRMRLSIGEVNLDDVIQQAVDAVRYRDLRKVVIRNSEESQLDRSRSERSGESWNVDFPCKEFVGIAA